DRRCADQHADRPGAASPIVGNVVERRRLGSPDGDRPGLPTSARAFRGDPVEVRALVLGPRREHALADASDAVPDVLVYGRVRHLDQIAYTDAGGARGRTRRGA